MFTTFHRLRRVQHIPATIEECWEFFSDPRNLPKITPPWLDFQIDPLNGDEFYPGMIITYRVRPLLGIPVRWMTEITHVREPSAFIDEQRFGPYRMWHHEHHFRKIDGGTEITDDVRYVIGFGPLDPWINRWVVRPKVEEIFEYRFEQLKRIFGSIDGPAALANSNGTNSNG